MEMLNVGCGNSFHQDWVNIDINTNNKSVIKHDIKTGLPFENETFKVVYCSHVLEHFDPDSAEKITNEIFRVLMKGGIVRILVPDLESICRNYLKYMEDAASGDNKAEFKYDYSLLEMFDQMVRTESGGRLGKLWRSGDIPDMSFILNRNGIEAKQSIDEIVRINTGEIKTNSNRTYLAKAIIKTLKGILNYRIKIPEAVIRLFLGKEYVNYFRESIFRGKGEIHRFMYDRYSMARLLGKCGFREIKQCTAGQTEIKDFHKYQFEITGGMIRKPDSLYMEAVK